MPSLALKPQVEKFIKKLPQKHQKQLKGYILNLGTNPNPHDARPLIGYEFYMRADVGEYRLIYEHDLEKNLLTVLLAGRRNDDAIYKLAKRNLR